MDSYPRLMALESFKAQHMHEQSPEAAWYLSKLQSRPPVIPRSPEKGADTIGIGVQGIGADPTL